MPPPDLDLINHLDELLRQRAPQRVQELAEQLGLEVGKVNAALRDSSRFKASIDAGGWAWQLDGVKPSAAPTSSPMPRPRRTPVSRPSVVDQEIDEAGATDTSTVAPAVPDPAPIVDQVETPPATPIQPSSPITIPADTPQEPSMSSSMIKKDVLALVARVESEIARRGLTIALAMGEIGCSPPAIYGWRKGSLSEEMATKISTWLEVSTQRKAKSADEPATADGTAAAAPKAIRSSRKAPSPASDDGLSLVQALARGDELAEHLENLGATAAVVTVRALTGRLRQVSQAVSA